MSARAKALLVTALAALALGCVGPEDNPTSVRDLRVLAVSLDPPEILAPSCRHLLVLASGGAITEPIRQQLALFAAPIRLTALLADPRGQGRAISYQLFSCPSRADRTTCEAEADRVQLGEGTTAPGELVLPGLEIGASFAGDVFLMQRVVEEDPFRGMGGIRVPLNLRIRAGSEEVYAQKLMPYGCRFFPDMKVNATPVLPGLTVDGQDWGDEPILLRGRGPFAIAANDFSSLQERYVVPSYELKPVHLVESWKLSWHTDSGRISPSETGGTDVDGSEEKHRVQWSPPIASIEQDVTFWAVVRDGRGGQSWLVRRAHHVP